MSLRTVWVLRSASGPNNGVVPIDGNYGIKITKLIGARDRG